VLIWCERKTLLIVTGRTEFFKRLGPPTQVKKSELKAQGNKNTRKSLLSAQCSRPHGAPQQTKKKQSLANWHVNMAACGKLGFTEQQILNADQFQRWKDNMPPRAQAPVNAHRDWRRITEASRQTLR